MTNYQQFYTSYYSENYIVRYCSINRARSLAMRQAFVTVCLLKEFRVSQLPP